MLYSLFINSLEIILKILLCIIYVIGYILDKSFLFIISFFFWYYEIEYKQKKPNLYQKYGFDEKYKSPEMDNFLENYTPISEHHYFEKKESNKKTPA